MHKLSIKLTNDTKLYFLFFLSGFVNLFLQVIWGRQLTHVFGSTIYSIIIILVSWMVGIAIGSFLVTLLRKNFSNLYTVYCYFQLGVLFFALIFPIILSILNVVDRGLFTITQNSLSISLLSRGIFIFMSLLIPTTLIGATFPLISEVVGEKRISYIYSINALGSALGALLTGFVLIPYLGTITSMIFVLIICITIFVFGIAFSVEYKLSPDKAVNNNLKKTKNINSKLKNIIIFLIPFLFLISGFTTFSYGVLYNRILAYFTDISSYFFTIIVTIFMLGISLGSFLFYLVKKKLSSFNIKLIIFAISELAIGIWHIFLPAYSNKVNLLSEMIKSFLLGMPIFSVFFTRIFISILIILPPITIFGFLFPLVIDIFLQISHKETTKKVGILYSFNTIGLMLGVLLTGTIFIKYFHISSSMRIITQINIIVSIIIMVLFFIIIFKRKVIFFTSLGLSLFAFLITAFFMNKINLDFTIGKKASLATKFDKLLYYDEGMFGTISISQKWDSTLNLKINGVSEVATDYNSIRALRLLGCLPFVINRDAKTLLEIGFRGGITFGSICQVSSLEYKKNIEICKGVINAADKFYDNWNHNVTKTNRDDIIIGDGRRFLKNTDKKFDIIISDSSRSTTFDGLALNTKEFYAKCKGKLNTGGVMVQLVPIHNLSVYDYKTILKTFSLIFEKVNLFFCEEYTIIVGSDKKIILNKIGLNNLLTNKVIHKDLSLAKLDTFKSISNTKIFGNNLFNEFCKAGGIATDNQSPLQFSDIRRLGKDARITITNALYDFLKKENFKNYMTITLNIHNLFYQKKYIEAIFYLHEQINFLQQNNEYDDEIESLLTRLQKKISIEFSKPTNLKYYLNNFSMDNLRKLEKLNKIMGDNHNILLLIAKYEYHIGNNKKTLEIFYKMQKLYHDPDTYRNLIIHLLRLKKVEEAKNILKEAREKFGKKWGGKLDLK